MAKIDPEEVVNAVFEEGSACLECPYSYSYPDRWDEPGGRECQLQDFHKDDCSLCPGYEKMKAKMEAGNE